MNGITIKLREALTASLSLPAPQATYVNGIKVSCYRGRIECLVYPDGTFVASISKLYNLSVNVYKYDNIRSQLQAACRNVG